MLDVLSVSLNPSIPSSPLIHLIYVSSATKNMSDDELRELLTQSRDRNSTQNVTGLLLYVGNKFMQVLEGAMSDIDDIYSSIQKDERNTGNIVLIKEPVSERSFPNWSMGFKSINSDTVQIEGYSDFLDQAFTPEKIAKQCNKAIAFLLSFRNANSDL